MTTETFAVFLAGARVGSIVVRHDEDQIRITSQLDSNGRGVKLDERLRLDAAGIPVAWRVSGRSLAGAAVSEEFAASADGGAGGVFVPAETSAFAVWVYARAALAAGGEVATLPGGRVRVASVREERLGAREVRVFVVSGARLVPEWVVMDSDGGLIAVVGGGRDEVVVRDDLASCRQWLAGLVDECVAGRLREVAGRVAHHFDEPVRVVNVRVFDPASQALGELASVTFFRGRITTVEPFQPGEPGAGVVLDGGGGTLLAGLHDMHAHVDGWAGLFYLAAGVTTVRDMGNQNERLLELEESFESGELAGPTIVRSGLLEGRSEFSWDLGVIPETLDEALDLVRWYADRGYHQIKIYNSMNPVWVPKLAAQAHRLGLRVVGHVPAFTTPDRMIEAGYDEITHVNQLMLGWLIDEREDTRTPFRVTALTRSRDLDLTSEPVRHTLDLMREHGVGVDTTIQLHEAMMLGRNGVTLDADAPVLTHLPLAYQRYRRRAHLPHESEADLLAYEQAYGRVMDVVRLLREEGIPLWPGTDDATGFALHRELELYTTAGFTPAEVLTIATRACADHLGLGHTQGRIERGRTASFVLVDGDPTQDISAIRNIRTVVHNGCVYYPSEIYTELGITPFVEPARATDSRASR